MCFDFLYNSTLRFYFFVSRIIKKNVIVNYLGLHVRNLFRHTLTKLQFPQMVLEEISNIKM
jgi:hypothetical protein